MVRILSDAFVFARSDRPMHSFVEVVSVLREVQPIEKLVS